MRTALLKQGRLMELLNEHKLVVEKCLELFLIKVHPQRHRLV